MAAKKQTRPPGSHAPPPASKPGRGAKYALVQAVLGVDPEGWIRARREHTFRHDDGTRRAMSFREISEDITRRMQAAGHPTQYVTIETVARWLRPVRKAS